MQPLIYYCFVFVLLLYYLCTTSNSTYKCYRIISYL